MTEVEIKRGLKRYHDDIIMPLKNKLKDRKKNSNFTVKFSLKSGKAYKRYINFSYIIDDLYASCI